MPTEHPRPEPSRRAWRWIAPPVAVLLASCAASPTTSITSGPIVPYRAPTGADTARLVVRAMVPPGDAYVLAVYGDGEHCAGPQMIGSGNAVQHAPSTTLAAGVPTTFEFAVITAKDKTCSLRYTFTPGAGKAYLLAAAALGTGCGAILNDMSDPEHIEKLTTVLRRNPPGGARCVPIAQSKAIPVAAAASAASSPDAVLNEGATPTDLEGLIAP